MKQEREESEESSVIEIE
jgi:hypothetical protein